MTRRNEPGKRFALTTALVAAFALVFSALALIAAPAQAAGNSGSIKIHAAGSPDGTESNEPKVCAFNIEAFDFDPGFEGYLKFEVQGGDGPTGVAAGPFEVGTADANGYFATDYFNVEGGVDDIQDGHYVVTLYGKFNATTGYEDEKAKSKVFKVDCPVTPATPTAVTASDVCEPATGTNDRITIPADANFTYKVDGTTVPAGEFVASGTSHTVTAVARRGVTVEVGAKTEWTFTFTKVLCVTPPPPRTPAAATASDVCEPATGLTRDRITIPTDANFTYTVDNVARAAGPFVAIGTTHTVRAVAKAGVVVATGATTQWTFNFTKVLCSEVLGAEAKRVRGAVRMIDKCDRSGDVFLAKRVKGVKYLVKGKAIRKGVWLRAKTRTVRVRAVPASSRYNVVGKDRWVLRFTNKPCDVAPAQLPATGA